MDKPLAYVVLEEIDYFPYPEVYVLAVVASEQEAWDALSKELNNVLNNVYANVKFIPHPTMPGYIGVKFTEYLPHAVRIKYTIHKKRTTIPELYKAYCV